MAQPDMSHTLASQEGLSMTAHTSVEQRVRQMMASARLHFGCSMILNQSDRTEEQAQQFHICHMFLHNFFKSRRPEHVAPNGRTIKWEYLADPRIEWALIKNPEKDFLYGKDHRPAKRQMINGRPDWVAGHGPEKH